MKNKIYFAFFALLVFLSAACNKGKSYTELLKEERTAIDRLIIQNDFVILKEFPADTVFGEKEFYKTSDGLYLNIIDRGIPVEYKDNWSIYLRYRGYMRFKNDTTKYSDMSGQIKFMYNVPSSYLVYSDILCNGIMEPLKYVGYEGKARLIIPSKQGTSAAEAGVYPVYFDEVIYTVDIENILNNM